MSMVQLISTRCEGPWTSCNEGVSVIVGSGSRDSLTNSGTNTTYWIARYKESSWCFEGRNTKPPWIITILFVVLFTWWRSEGMAIAAPLAVIGLWRMHFEKNALADCAHALNELKGQEYDRDELSKPLTLEEKAMLEVMKKALS